MEWPILNVLWSSLWCAPLQKRHCSMSRLKFLTNSVLCYSKGVFPECNTPQAIIMEQRQRIWHTTREALLCIDSTQFRRDLAVQVWLFAATCSRAVCPPRLLLLTENLKSNRCDTGFSDPRADTDVTPPTTESHQNLAGCDTLLSKK